MALAVQFYDVVLWLHIVAFLIAFGPTYGYGIFMAAAAKAGPAAQIEAVKAMARWDRIAITTGAIVLLVTGHYMAAELWDFGDFFVNWGNVAILVILGFTHAYFVPRERRVIALLEGGQEEEAQAVGQKIAMVGAFMGVLVILTVYVMAAKPFL
ncbi:MAG: DUF2269 family protein [Actinomycetota bacterium]|nr:DUF2269 family protein [Actinomycetota bacterium]